MIAVQHFWSVLSPSEECGAANPANNVFLMHMRSSPLAYLSYSISISINFDYITDKSPSQPTFQLLRAKHIHAATQLVRKTIQDMPDRPSTEHVSDELIGAIITLSTNPGINVGNKRNWSMPRSRSPMATFQCLDIWGALPVMKPHRLAIVQLVELRGGLDQLSLTMAGVVIL